MDKVKIFISYKRNKDELLRTAIAGILKKVPNQNIEVMFDEILVPHGEEIHVKVDAYINKMDNSDYLVAIITQAKDRDEIVREMTLAKAKGVKIIAFADDQVARMPFDQRDPKHIKFNLANIDDRLDELIIALFGKQINASIKDKNFWNAPEIKEPQLQAGLNVSALFDPIFRSKLKSRWLLTFVGENPHEQVVSLKSSLTKKNKNIPSGYSYWGVGPMLKWIAAINDDQYSTMTKSLRSFGNYWNGFDHDELNNIKAYISLGSGTGEKDISILRSLLEKNDKLIYIPVDMSSNMLEECITKLRDQIKNYPYQCILPIEMDFYKHGMLLELRKIIEKIIPNKEKILFSILGNTLANFENDDLLLKDIRNNLMDPNDLLLLELSKLGKVDDDILREIKHEYTCDAFRQFALSSLLQNTGLHIENQNYYVDITEEKFSSGNNNASRSILIECKYKNNDDHIKSFKFLDGREIDFSKDDSIRVYLSRKYTSDGIKKLLEIAEVEKLTEVFMPYEEHLWESSDPLGNSLILTKQIKSKSIGIFRS